MALPHGHDRSSTQLRLRELIVPRYFLNIRDPHLDLIPDPEGDAAADLDAVSLIVSETIRDILAPPEA